VAHSTLYNWGHLSRLKISTADREGKESFHFIYFFKVPTLPVVFKERKGRPERGRLELKV